MLKEATRNAQRASRRQQAEELRSPIQRAKGEWRPRGSGTSFSHHYIAQGNELGGTVTTEDATARPPATPPQVSRRHLRTRWLAVGSGTRRLTVHCPGHDSEPGVCFRPVEILRRECRPMPGIGESGHRELKPALPPPVSAVAWSSPPRGGCCSSPAVRQVLVDGRDAGPMRSRGLNSQILLATPAVTAFKPSSTRAVGDRVGKQLLHW